MELLGKALNRTLQKKGYQKKIEANKAVIYWNKVVGERIAKHSRAEYVKEGVLTVTVPDSVWLYHLVAMKKEIVDKLNTLQGGKMIINDIRFRQKKLEVCAEQERATDKNAVQLPSLTTKDRQKIEKIINELTPQYEEERLLLKSLLEKEYRRKKYVKMLGWKPCKRCGVYSPSLYCDICALKH